MYINAIGIRQYNYLKINKIHIKTKLGIIKGTLNNVFDKKNMLQFYWLRENKVWISKQNC